ncbi:MAG: pyridoxamine 5'-phosphate oxidase family protein [Candidatus Omnitrophica bacterium]|nr:pyridoxamine 5'-phosphate oxidase family protein [Candidatus Omnitrophota bacterium]MBU4589424.1 pyridoxamine 5'-phosphate oxidase family protein [Candidatus Omnitrophota bacterium]
MKKLNQGIIGFFHKQPYTIVTTIDRDGSPHNSCKGIVDIEEKGLVYLLDVYKEKTYANLKENQNISITAVDEHKFMGYCLKGAASIVKEEDLHSRTIKSWEGKLTKRISERLLKNLKGEKGHPRHPEASLPKPEYLIAVEVKEIIDLTPHHIRHGDKKDT